jgi:tRNA(Ile)-lysidine synthase
MYVDVQKWLGNCEFPPAGTPLVCGVSGGADSLALLVLAVAAGCAVTAVHVDHGLRPGSGEEADIVRGASEQVGAAFRAERVDVEPGPNLEARAREARLSVFAAVAGDGRFATGHTLDDRAETILLNLVRGTGPGGLGMLAPSHRHPLTRLRRADTIAVCEAADLRPLHDPSNDDPAFVRNRIRHEVLPLLDRIASRDVAPLLVRFAELATRDAAHLAELAEALDPTDAPALATAPWPLASRAVSRWLANPYPPDLDTVERVLAVARGDAIACEVGGGRRVARTAQRLRLDGPSSVPPR